MKKDPLHVDPKYNLEINQTAFRCHGRLGRFDSALTVLLITVFYQEFHSDPWLQPQVLWPELKLFASICVSWGNLIGKEKQTRNGLCLSERYNNISIRTESLDCPWGPRRGRRLPCTATGKQTSPVTASGVSSRSVRQFSFGRMVGSTCRAYHMWKLDSNSPVSQWAASELPQTGHRLPDAKFAWILSFPEES